jgi:hypothetical protein
MRNKMDIKYKTNWKMRKRIIPIIGTTIIMAAAVIPASAADVITQKVDYTQNIQQISRL